MNQDENGQSIFDRQCLLHKCKKQNISRTSKNFNALYNFEFFGLMVLVKPKALEPVMSLISKQLIKQKKFGHEKKVFLSLNGR